jgi:mannosyltransferase OCH1-like enzyme
MIPKIIHQSAPKDTNVWHPLWFECQESWKRNFPESEYQYIMWNDDDIDELVKNNYPEHWNYFKDIRPHIVKIDISRFFILHHYGGIYADMDTYCYGNFYTRIKSEKVLLVQSSYLAEEKYQNSLMCSEKNNSFFIDCIEEAFKRSKIFGNFDIFDKNFSPEKKIPSIIKVISGPILLTKLLKDRKYKNIVKCLHYAIYNARPKEYSNKIYVRHMLTGQWGNDTIDYLIKQHKILEFNANERIEFSELRKIDYKQSKDIDISNFNFYKDLSLADKFYLEMRFDYDSVDLEEIMNPIPIKY